MSSRYQQLEMPVNLTRIAADYLAARYRCNDARDKTHGAIMARARKSALAAVLTHGLALHVQANFGEIISLVDALDAHEFPVNLWTITSEQYDEIADDIIDEYMEFARAASVSMAKAIDAVEDAFTQVGDDE